MLEIEVKVEADHQAVRKHLSDLDPDHLGAVRQHDTYYDHPNRRFAETDEALRLRTESTDEGGEAIWLTYKGPLVETASKTREEVEVSTADRSTTATFLERLGFEPVADVRKTRDRFAVSGYLVSLDEVDGLGEFVEVESEGSAADVGPERDGAYRLLRELGVDPDTQIRASYLELLLDAE